MTDLPSLSPNNDNISWIAYYDVSEFVSNSNFVPEDLNNPSRAKGLELYDNGVKFEYEHPIARKFTVRAGNDGWITAHMNTKKTYTQDSKTDISKFNGVNSYSDLSFSDLSGDYDIMPWSANIAEARGLERNTLYETIRDCLNNSSFWDSSDYNPTDLGLHNYRFGNSNVSVFSSRDSDSYEFTYTNNTTIKAAYLASSIHGDTSRQGFEAVSVSVEGTKIAGNTGGSDYVAVDITEIARNNDTVKTRLRGNAGFTNGGYGSIYCIVIWQ